MKNRLTTMFMAWCLVLLMAAGVWAGERKLSLWWTVEYSAEEKAALESIISDFQKQTGIKVEWSGYSSTDLWAKVMAGIEAGNPPDVSQVLSHSLVLLADRGLLTDVSDLMEKYKADMIPAGVEASYIWNSKANKRSYYCIPFGLYTMTINYWTTDIKKAGFDKLPADWNGFWGAFEKAQTVTGIPATGWSLSDRAEFDVSWAVEQFIAAYGGRLMKDGKLDLSAENRNAVIEALKFHTKWYLENKSPKGVTEWGDADNNTNLQTHKMSVTMNATLSIPRWFYDKERDKYFNETASANYPQPGPLGKPYPVLTNIYPMIIPANAPNPKEAKEFVDFFMQKKNYDKYIKGLEARFFPMYKTTFDDPYFSNQKDPHIYPTRMHFFGPAIPINFMLHPAYAKFVIGHGWHKMVARVAVDKWTPEKAADEALDGLKRTFERY